MARPLMALEGFFERLLERPAARLFRVPLQPVQLERRLDRAMDTERRLSAYLADFENVTQDKTKPHQHPGIEFVYVVQGELSLRIGGEDYQLAEGDAIYFDGTMPHTYRRIGDKFCQGLVVTTPQ